MGVHGLWDLLAPVGRRVSVETLAGKRLAIDASIWMVQFMKAMRDDKGEMVRNAHLLGFFRRICKLLFLRTKPVFVFDGATPALKRRTVIARRRQRENAQAKIRKTAEKLFLNQMKAMRLNNLAENLKGQKDMSKLKGKEIMVENSDTLRENDAALGVKNQENLDEMFAASILAEECGELDRAFSPPAAPVSNASASVSTSTSKSASAAAITLEDEDGDDDDDEEMMMPITDGNVDPAVLAALPPSMQLDLLVQMRERLMAENRQKYQKVKKAPQKFSELQIEAYLKTVAFRREIDVVQKAAAGKEVGGVQTSRIASEANREFIFSSSFSGDKQALASSGAENYSEKQQGLEKKESSSGIGDVIAASASKSNAEAQPLAGEVETYLDEKGRTRIHRTRAMGIRMTRDLQRNIDLMKESEHDRTTSNNNTNVRTELDSAAGPSESSDCEVQFVDAIEKVNSNHKSPRKSLLEIEACKDAPKTASCINISFCDDGKHMSVEDDEFFSRLVAGSPVSLCSDDNSASDIEWEDGTNVEQSNHLVVGNKVETNVAWKEGSNISDGKLEAMKNIADNRKKNEFESDWKKDGTNNFREVQEISVDVSKAVSKGCAEEEAALQDAIRRSLEDITAEKTSTNSVDLGKSNSGSNMLELGSSSPQLTSTIEDVFLGNVPRQPFAIGNDQSSILAVKDAYAPSTSDRLSDSAVDVTTTNLTTARSNENNLCFQHSETSTESVEIRNLSNDGSSVPTVTTFGILSSSLQAPFDANLTNEDSTTNLSDMSVGHGAPTTTVETSHGGIHIQIPEEDISFVSVLERGQDLKFTAPDDVDMNGDLLSASLEDELLELGKEFKDLENEQKKLERNADSINSEMFVECQELLQMFGLPYIIAPMEAEAQCAFLETANLVDGVVTDDSDVFLFGAQSVFKNIFDDRKYVETYFLKGIESELGLNTEKLIRMALLLGSDYTEGVSGIGIVNAIEVVNAFPEDNGLLKFREWVESPDPSILGKVGRQSVLSAKKNGSKGTLEADCNSSGENEDAEDTDSRERKELFMNKHRNVSKNWHIPASFPSDAVISAYKNPQVDKSAEPFAWGKPDIFSLRRLCSEKFSWANQKADELLLPVLKEYNKHETQLRLEAFYSFNEKFANIRSKRIRQAVKGITGKRALANTDDSEELLKQVKKRGRNASDKGSSKKEDGPRKRSSSTKRPKSKKIGVEEGESMQMTDEAEETRVDSTGLSKARGRSGKAVRRGRRKDSSDSELGESSTYNLIGSSDAHDHVLQPEKTALPLNVRRSKRARRTTCYVEKEEESDDLTMSPATTSERCSNDDTGQQISLECQDALKTDSIDASRPQGVTSDDYFPGNGFCGDYLVEGGGFCADEDDVGLTSDRVGSIQCDGPDGTSVDDDSEYLQMGGGFCTDDADEGLDILDCGGAGASTGAVADISVTPSKVHEASHIVDEHGREVVPTLTPTVAPAPDGVQVLQNSPSFVSEVNPSEQHELTGTDPFNVGQTQTVGDHNTSAFVNPFGAIPFLKKKKRKP